MAFAAGYALAAPLALGVMANWSGMPAIVHHLGGPTAAAWAQAFGTFGAILGALWLQDRQRQRDRKSKGDDELEALWLIAASSAEALLAAQVHCHSQGWSQPLVDFERMRLRNEIEILSSVSSPALPNRKARLQLYQLRAALFATTQIYDAIDRALAHGMQLPKDMLDDAIFLVVEARDVLDAMVPSSG